MRGRGSPLFAHEADAASINLQADAERAGLRAGYPQPKSQ